jgi:hypothetical protein
MIPIGIVLKYILLINATNHYVMNGAGGIYP